MGFFKHALKSLNPMNAIKNPMSALLPGNPFNFGGGGGGGATPRPAALMQTQQMPQRSALMSNALMGGGQPQGSIGAQLGGAYSQAPQGNTMSNSMQGGLMGMPPLPGAQPGMPGVAAAQASMQPMAQAAPQQPQPYRPPMPARGTQLV